MKGNLSSLLSLRAHSSRLYRRTGTTWRGVAAWTLMGHGDMSSIRQSIYRSAANRLSRSDLPMLICTVVLSSYEHLGFYFPGPPSCHNFQGRVPPQISDETGLLLMICAVFPSIVYSTPCRVLMSLTPFSPPRKSPPGPPSSPSISTAAS